jgi:hypothetical protein
MIAQLLPRDPLKLKASIRKAGADGAIFFCA